MKAIKLMLALIVILLVVVIAMNVRNDSTVDNGSGGEIPYGDDGLGDDSEDGSDEENDMVKVTSLESGDKVTSPLTVTGEARGGWYSEGQFPVKLLDASGATIAAGVAHATGDWMTTEFSPYSITLTFPAQAAGSVGTLVIEKDNPSGLPENADELRIEVKF